MSSLAVAELPDQLSPSPEACSLSQGTEATHVDNEVRLRGGRFGRALHSGAQHPSSRAASKTTRKRDSPEESSVSLANVQKYSAVLERRTALTRQALPRDGRQANRANW